MFINNRPKTWKALSMICALAFLISPMAPLWAQQLPKKYIAHAAIDSLIIDGLDSEDTWQKATWSEPFIDIEGKVKPKHRTQMKMAWDEDFLYFFARLEEPHIWGNLRQRDTVIFQNNDFEIFIDPDGDTHNYYEFEMNALNTVWDLFLTRPYRNGTIVLDHWNINGLLSAVHIDGTLNDPSDVDRHWSVEIAIPWDAVTEASGSKYLPRDTFWRINFSRVNWQHEIIEGNYRRKKDESGKRLPEYNWVWSPQYKINMHMPEYWGYVYFSTDPAMELDNFTIPADDQIKWYLYQDYNRVRAQLADGKSLRDIQLQEISLMKQRITPSTQETAVGWYLQVESPFSNRLLIIDQNGLFRSMAAGEN
ncbi:MAG: carbohydrate-binding family 9-like protein [Saprospiraceae bacterium]|nr:carbohydrate-binding family 9-like protein [Saprospiraceae bacterium]